MTKIKLCGLTQESDIEFANELNPEYVGFVFYEKSRRYIDAEKARQLKKLLSPEIKAVGVFVNESAENIAKLLNGGVIDIAQLHGSEDETCIKKLRSLCDKPIIKAFRIEARQDIIKAEKSSADFVLLDSGKGGTGTVFDWTLIKGIGRPYFLAGGLNSDNVSEAIKDLSPYAVDVSSGIETNGMKDKVKAASFVAEVRKEDKV
ncbi:MAG: phosphoribosylanthranilate isomerase [Acutalibacteraceae bacterium]